MTTRAKREGLSSFEAYLLDRADDLVRDEGLSFKEAYMSARRTYPAIAGMASGLRRIDVSHMNPDEKLRALRDLGEQWNQTIEETDE